MSNYDAAGRASPAPPPERIGRSVALIGIDGAGKSTVAHEVIGRLPFDASYLYMGVNLAASPVMLPTTRLALAIKRRRGGNPDMTVGHSEPGSRHGGPLVAARRLIRITNWLAEEAYRAALARRIRRRPALVVFDRHFFCDYYATAIAPTNRRRPLDARIHGYVLRHWYPKPELTLFLDAPPEVLIARKRGESLERVAKRRVEYLDLERVLPAFQVVNADRPVGDVVDDIVGRIVAFVSGDTIDGGTSSPAKKSGAPGEPTQTSTMAPADEQAASIAQPTIADSPSVAGP
jgi:thymidylate kinase